MAIAVPVSKACANQARWRSLVPSRSRIRANRTTHRAGHARSKYRHSNVISIPAHIQDALVVAPPAATMNGECKHAVMVHVAESHGSGGLLHC
jgi:hypothetical protein